MYDEDAEKAGFLEENGFNKRNIYLVSEVPNWNLTFERLTELTA